MAAIQAGCVGYWVYRALDEPAQWRRWYQHQERAFQALIAEIKRLQRSNR